MKKKSLLSSKTVSRFCLGAALLGMSFAYVRAEDVVKTDAVLQDAFVNQQPAQVDAVQGAGTLYLKNQGDGIRNTYFQLDLTYLDGLTATQVDETSVNLRLYVFRGNTNLDNQAIEVYAITDAWDETTLTWNNAPEITGTPVATSQVPAGVRASITDFTGATSGQQGATDNPFKAAQYIRIDITEYAIARYKADNKTIAIALKYPAVENNGDTQIISKDADVTTLGDGGAAKHPALVYGEKIVPEPTITKNLILGGHMNVGNKARWTVKSYNAANIVATWGVTEGAPTAGAGGALHAVGTSPASGSYAIYQAVELEAGVAYQADAAYSVIGQKNTAWVEFYLGKADPETVNDYTAAIATDSEGKQLTSLFNWSNQPTVLDGTFKANANSKPTPFTPTTSGTYYFLVKFGANGADGHFDVLLDEIKLTYAAPDDGTGDDTGDDETDDAPDPDGGGNGIQQTEAKGYTVYAEDGQIKLKSNNVLRNVSVYNAGGVLVVQAKVHATRFTSKTLSAGVYIVVVDGVADKVVVR